MLILHQSNHEFQLVIKITELAVATLSKNEWQNLKMESQI